MSVVFRRAERSQGKCIGDANFALVGRQYMPSHTVSERRKRRGKVPVGKKFRKVMREFGKGTLRSSSGEKVTSQKQAVAIAASEQRQANKGKHKRRVHRGGGTMTVRV